MEIDHCYMAVTRDKYQLPVAVCDTIGELASKVGASKASIASSVSRMKSGEYKSSGYIRVDFDDEE